MKKFLLTTHLVVGLCAALVLIVLSLSGALIAFEPELNRAMHPELTRVAVTGPPMNLDVMKKVVEQQTPGWKVVRFYLPDQAGLATYLRLRNTATKRQRHIYANPYTGAVLGSTEDGADLLIRIHDLHVNFLTGNVKGRPGSMVVMAGTWALLVLSLTGIVLWFPRRVFRFQPGVAAPRLNRDLHLSLGFWTSLAMFGFAVTGVGLHYQTGKLLGLLNRPENSAATVGRGNSIEAIMQSAREALPGAAIPRILLPEKSGDPVFVYMRFPEDHTPAGRSFATFEPKTGNLLSVGSSRTAPVMQAALVRFTREIHTGTLFGVPSRILVVLLSLALCVLAVTGPMIWWFKQAAVRRGRRALAERQAMAAD